MIYTMIKRFYLLLLAIVASVGMSYAFTPLEGDIWDDNTKTLTVNSTPSPSDYYNDQSEIKRLVISSSVTEIGEQAFSGSYNLQEVIAYEGLQVIDQSAFASCPELESVILPSTLREVRYSAFWYCENLKYVTINASSLEEYQEYAFDDTHTDLKIYVPEASLATYKTNWSAYADKFQAIPSSLAVGDTLKVGDAMYSATDVYVDAGYLRFQIKASSLHTITAIAPNGAGTNIKVEFTPYAEQFYPSGSYAALTNWFYCPSEYTSGDVTEITVVSGTGTLDDPFVIDYVQPAAPAYETVMNLINAIGTVEKTAECKAKIDAARAAYNGLSAEDQALVTNYDKLTAAEAAWAAPMDLSTITSDYEVPDGTTLTGTLGTNVKITIAAGATVTLNGVDINSSGTWTGGDYAGITCPGNATIILADGTVNRIKGFLNGNSAIHIKPNYTLTIEGNGTLYASTQGGAAAIGCGYSDQGGSRNGGNIVINGGTIYANGGSLAAGIGGGGRATIGNITINGGIIYAVGGGTGAGIGGGQSKSSSWKSICGNITISSNVKYLKATKGSGAEHSIGKGSSSYSVCGTVTIPGGATGYVSTSPYVYCNPDYVIELINAIPQPVVYTEECKAAIDEARAMYTALTADQKTSVTNYSTLTDAEAAYAALPVEDKIAAIGTVEYTAESKALIDAARTAYDALSDEAKALVTNYSTLTDAETAYNQAAAAPVIAQIEALPATPLTEETTKLSVYDKVVEARAAYDALSDEEKAAVTNYDKLTDLEAAFAAIGGGGAPTTLIGDGTEQNPYLIGSLEAWNAFVAAVNGGQTNVYAQLTNNISGVTTMAGTFDYPYSGTFDGNGFTMTINISINEDCVGVFRYAKNATIRNLNVEGTITSSGQFVGSIVGEIPNSSSSLTLQNLCSSVAITLSAAYDLTSAGIVGIRRGGSLTITDCLFKGSLTSTDNVSYCGGIVGYGTSNTVVMTRVIQAGTFNLGSSDYDAVFIRNNDNYFVANDCYYINGVGGATSCDKATKITTSQLNTQTYVDLLQTDKTENYWELKEGVLVWAGRESAASDPIADAKAVLVLINAIPDPVVYPDSKGAIDAARTALDALSDEAKSLFVEADTIKLPNAEATYAGLLAALVKEVVDKIDALPATPLTPENTKLSVYEKVVEARAAYDSLTDELKAAVTNYDKLTDAEAAFAAIGGGGTLPTGALPGKFSINAGGDQIAFSKGNLQATTADNGTSWTWSFAEHQYDYIGNAVANTAINGNAVVSENGTVDLFGWSTSKTYYGIHSSGEDSNYSGNFVDWGENAISNGGNTANTWRTPTNDEWVYIINTRTTASGIRYAKATVNGITGLIVLPDDWSTDYYALESTNTANAAYTSNEISLSDWTNSLEAHAAVFLPAAGFRTIKNVYSAGSDGRYWSSTTDHPANANYLNFGSSSLNPENYVYRRSGHSVRLVVDAPAANPIAEAQAVLALINAIPDPVVYPDSKGAIDAARTALDALSDEAKNLFVEADTIKLPNAEAAYALLKADHDAAEAVEALIDAIPTPVVFTDACKEAIDTARVAYEALTDAQKALVDADKLTALEIAEADYAKLVADHAAADAVIAKIDALPDSVLYTEAHKALIDSARVAYNALTDDQKALVSVAQYAELTTAEAAYTLLQDGVDDAKALIAAIPATIEYNDACKNAIETAFAAYEALTNEQKAAVSNKETLTDAVMAWAALVAKIEHNVTYIGKDGELKTEVVALLNIPEAPEVNGFEFVEWFVRSSELYNEGVHLQAVYAPLITLDPQAYDTLAYTGLAQTLIKAGQAKEGHIEYRIGEGAWSTTLPQATNAGAYAIQYKLVREGHEDYIAPQPVVAEIAKVPVTYVAPVAYDTLVYTAAPQTLIIAGQTQDGTFEYTLTPTDEQSWKAELPQSTAADTLYVHFRVIGDANHRDSVAPAPVQAIIAKAPLTATADNKTVIYGDPIPQYTVTYTGWQGEDTLDVLVGQIMFSCEYMDTVSVGEYPIVPSGVTAHDYTLNFVPGKVIVNKAKVVYVAPVAYDTLVYNNAAQTLIQAGMAEGGEMQYSLTPNVADSWATALPQATNAGIYNAYFRVIGDKNHLDSIAPAPVAVTIAKAALTATADDKTVIYGDAIPTYTVTYTGWQGTDAASVLTGTIAYACDYQPTSNVGDYTITPSGVDAANYAITFVNGTLTVNKAKVVYVAPVAYDTLVYNNAAQTLIIAGATNDGTMEYSLTPTDAESWKTALPQALGAGTYNVSFRVVGDLNHLDSIAPAPVAVAIAKAALTATADDKTVIYGDAVPAYSVTYAGWQGTDDANVLTGAIAYDCAYAPTSNVGNYTIAIGGVDAANYAITFVNGKVTVNQAALTITADNKSVIYGDAAPAFTASYEGWKNNDTTDVISGLTLTSEYLVTSNVGTYDIVPANATATNYAITFVKGTLTVNQAPLKITADNKTVEYGEVAPAFTASYEGWKNNDTTDVVTGLVFACEYLVTSNVGEYTIIPSGATATNYAISFVNGKLTVNQAPLMITADDKNVIYGDAVPTYTASYSGWKNDDSTKVDELISGLVFTCAYAETSSVGEYTITPANASATNYAISYTNGKVTVAQAALTITAEDKTMIYGDAHPEFTASYEGWKNSDDPSVISGLQFTTPYNPGSYIGTYAINPNSATAQNYAITFVDGTLTVNKAVVKVANAEAQIAKFADGHANAVVLNAGTLEGIKLNDPIAHVTTAAFSSADVAEHLTITLFYELTGDAVLLKNYDLQPTSEIFSNEGVIIEPFIPNNGHQPEEGEQVEVKEGIDVYAYGYCDGSGYSLKYHLESGNPDQYKIDFADSRFTDIDWTNLEITGKDGTIDIEIPVDLPTGDYTMTVYFRDSRFDWLESRQFNVMFHVNLPETYVRPLFDNVIALVDTCNCLTDIQWYWRANSSEPWQAIEGANGHYYRPANGEKLSGEYFVSAKMNGVPTYTCGQDDMTTLYGAEKKNAAKVRAFPNPVVNTTTVTIEGSDIYEHTLRVVNINGWEVVRSNFEGNQTTVEMGDYPQGNYMISVDGIVVKVMKQ